MSNEKLEVPHEDTAHKCVAMNAPLSFCDILLKQEDILWVEFEMKNTFSTIGCSHRR